MKSVFYAYFIVCAVMIVLGAIILLALVPMQYKKANGKKYSKTQQFPFELISYNESWLPYSRFLIILIAFFIAASSGLFLSVIGLFTAYISMASFIVASGVLSSFTFAALFFVKATKHLKVHIFTFTLFGVSSALFDTMNMIAFLQMPSNGGLPYFFAAMAGVLGIGKILFLVNPKLGHWAELDSSVDQDGVVTHTRPNPFVIALTQWVLVIGQIASALLGLIGFFVLILPLL